MNGGAENSQNRYGEGTDSDLKDYVTLPLVSPLTAIEAPDQGLRFEEFKTFIKKKDIYVDWTSFEKIHHLLTANGSFNLLASLLSDTNPLALNVAVFEGVDKLSPRRRVELGSHCLLTAMQQVIEAVDSLNTTNAEALGAGNEEAGRIDMTCFREALVNACVHTRWERMTPPAVYIFSDRVEIVSAGGLPKDLTREEFFAGQSRPVNLELMQIMLQAGFAEQIGHGVPMIISRYGQRAFSFSENFLTVTLPYHRSTVTFYEVTATRPVESALPVEASSERKYHRVNNAEDRRIRELQMMKEDPQISIAAMSEALGVSTASIMNDLNALKADGTVKREGSRKSGRWIVRGR